MSDVLLCNALMALALSGPASVGARCHGYGGRCPREATVLVGKARWCSQCAVVDPPTRFHSPAAESAEARAWIRDYDNPRNPLSWS